MKHNIGVDSTPQDWSQPLSYRFTLIPDIPTYWILTSGITDPELYCLRRTSRTKERVIVYLHKTFTPAECQYSVTRKEMFATVKTTKKFWTNLNGQVVELRTNCFPLKWLCYGTDPSKQMARWLEILAEFTYELEHQAGQKHDNADGWSKQVTLCGCDLYSL